jgi:hypothetical protein
MHSFTGSYSYCSVWNFLLTRSGGALVQLGRTLTAMKQQVQPLKGCILSGTLTMYSKAAGVSETFSDLFFKDKH